jgi:hypothetical protein
MQMTPKGRAADAGGVTGLAEGLRVKTILIPKYQSFIYATLKFNIS